MHDPKAFLRDIFDEAVRAVTPEACLAPLLKSLADMPRNGRLVVVGAGKAAAAMAREAEKALPGPIEGLVITRYGHAVPTDIIEVREAAHPVPDEAGVEATQAILELVRPLGKDDLVVMLLSGGGSALLSAPLPPIDLATKQAITAALLRNGASISEINTVRKHLSAVKGGRLAEAAAPATIVTLAISDVTTDDPAVIASGPTVGDPTTLDQAEAVLRRYASEEFASLGQDVWQQIPETIKPGAAILENSRYEIAASATTAIRAAQEYAPMEVTILSMDEEGEAATAAKAWAVRLLAEQHRLKPRAEPLLLLSSGEFTVTHGGSSHGGSSQGGSGQGGPNHEFMLALAIELEGAAGIWALSCDTDGIDGASDAAGALIGPDTLAEMAAKGIDPAAALAAHDSATPFKATGTAIVTGPTHTNVNDFRAFLVMHQ